MPDLISIIVSTFDRPDALDAVLRSLSRQDDRRFEVVIGDDGSVRDTADMIERWRPRLGAPLRYVWQQHRGFRLAEIRNRALRASAGDYSVFLDGDCLVRPDFVARHRRLAERGWFITGSRALLSQALTEQALRAPLEIECWGLTDWISQRFSGGLNRLAPVLRMPLGPMRKLRSHVLQGARACNFAVWRSDLDLVDGFDANFTGWGREDSDLIARLLHVGLRRKHGLFATGVLHLWHPDADRSELRANEQRLADVIASRRVRAERGLSTLDMDATADRADAPAIAARPRMATPFAPT
jgi:glycosyltransferase involved in cell wall biosynthesis